MNFITCNDLQYILNEFILDVKTLLAWRHTCRNNLYRKYYVLITTPKRMNFIEYKNKPYVHDIFKVLSIYNIPSYFDDSHIINCKYLMYLNCVNNNKITDISIMNTPNLIMLLCNNNITDTSVINLKHLITLDLTENRLISDISLQKLTNLKNLILSDSCLNISDKSIYQLTSLTKLNISNKYCKITNESINKLFKLKELYLGDNQYVDKIDLPNLNILYLNQKIKDSAFVSLCNLTYLYCDKNEFITNNVLYHLPNLIGLNCGFNPNFNNEGLKLVPNLTYLDCGFSTSFTNEGICILTKLRTLYCNCNTNFTDDIFIYLTDIIILNCGSNNNFTTKGITKLTNLEELVCRYGRSNISIADLKPLLKLKKVNGNIFHI